VGDHVGQRLGRFELTHAAAQFSVVAQGDECAGGLEQYGCWGQPERGVAFLDGIAEGGAR
jgi:hypothetical protein